MLPPRSVAASFVKKQISTLDRLNRRRTRGVTIAMDDFGTGHSSLSYLRHYPFDRIKLDGSFIRDLQDN
jgi:EAL domain-containing protein (putative c-di-GMP-specific phosphodiesterase class I)